MVRVWPIHKHKWTVISFIDGSSSHYPFRGISLSCYCKKIKNHKFKGGYNYAPPEALRYIEAKGWNIHAEV